MKNFLYSIAAGERTDWIAQLVRVPLFLFSLIYGLAVKAILFGYKVGILRRRRLSVPVISIGNLTLGGVGKTPMVIFVARMLKIKKLRTVILTRGYMPQKEQLLAAQENYLSDEAEVLRQMLEGVPVVVNPDRYEGGLEAIKKYTPDVIILDDGFQHWRLFRDLDIVLVDSVNPFGNGCLLPCGILREEASSLRRAGLVVLTKTDRGEVGELKEKIQRINPNAPIVQTVHRPMSLTNIFTKSLVQIAKLNQAVVAFCGIGDPKSFRSTLAFLGADVKEFVPFEDHHYYSLQDMDRLKSMCVTLGLRVLVTTQKDAVKLAEFKDFWQGFEIFSLNIEIDIIQGHHEFIDRIDRLLSH